LVSLSLSHFLFSFLFSFCGFFLVWQHKTMYDCLLLFTFKSLLVLWIAVEMSWLLLPISRWGFCFIFVPVVLCRILAQGFRVHTTPVPSLTLPIYFLSSPLLLTWTGAVLVRSIWLHWCSLILIVPALKMIWMKQATY
jgi:hypothetical protein